MGQRYIINTNIISHLLADKLPPKGKAFVTSILNTDFLISVVVEIEILTNNKIPDKMPLIEAFVNLATVLPLDTAVARKTIELRRKYRKLKLGDAIISATALTHNSILLSNNVKDFDNIKDLQVIDPHCL